MAKGGRVAGQHEAEAEQRQLRGGPQAGGDLCNAEFCDLQVQQGGISKYRLHIACVQGLQVARAFSGEWRLPNQNLPNGVCEELRPAAEPASGRCMGNLCQLGCWACVAVLQALSCSCKRCPHLCTHSCFECGSCSATHTESPCKALKTALNSTGPSPRPSECAAASCEVPALPDIVSPQAGFRA